MTGVDEFFEELRREYLTEAPARLGELRKDLAAIRVGEVDAAKSLKTRFHRLAGSGGSYGFPEISAVSREAERWIGSNPEPDAAGFAYLEQVIAKIAHGFDAAAAAVGLPQQPVAPSFGWHALVLGHDGYLTLVDSVLSDAQYVVTRRPLGTDPKSIPVSERPDVAVLLAATADEASGPVATWAAPGPARPSSVVLVAQHDRVDALAAPYADLDWIVAPERVETELPAFARTLARSATAPRSVLIVDPDEAAAASLAPALEGAGARVTVCRSGAQARDTLPLASPDLVLTEWVLPDTTGAAMIRWLRHATAQRQTPIVVHTGRISDADRLSAIKAGADDVMSKTVAKAFVAQSLLSRIDRSYARRALAHRDDLTGLLNYDTLVEELESAIRWGRRGGEPCAFMLIDLDHFRRINEEHGPVVGDAVLVQIARTVSGVVRSSDFVGRMGGEEIGIVVRRCNTENARLVAEKVRAAVNASPVLHGEVSVTVRLSIGVACYPDHGGSAGELLRIADHAMREAKAGGRDRVVVG